MIFSRKRFCKILWFLAENSRKRFCKVVKFLAKNAKYVNNNNYSPDKYFPRLYVRPRDDLENSVASKSDNFDQIGIFARHFFEDNVRIWFGFDFDLIADGRHSDFQNRKSKLIIKIRIWSWTFSKWKSKFFKSTFDRTQNHECQSSSKVTSSFSLLLWLLIRLFFV